MGTEGGQIWVPGQSHLQPSHHQPAWPQCTATTSPISKNGFLPELGLPLPSPFFLSPSCPSVGTHLQPHFGGLGKVGTLIGFGFTVTSGWELPHQVGCGMPECQAAHGRHPNNTSGRKEEEEGTGPGGMETRVGGPRVRPA